MQAERRQTQCVKWNLLSEFCLCCAHGGMAPKEHTAQGKAHSPSPAVKLCVFYTKLNSGQSPCYSMIMICPIQNSCWNIIVIRKD